MTGRAFRREGGQGERAATQCLRLRPASRGAVPRPGPPLPRQCWAGHEAPLLLSPPSAPSSLSPPKKASLRPVPLGPERTPPRGPRPACGRLLGEPCAQWSRAFLPGSVFLESGLSSDRTLLHGRHLSCLQAQEKGRGGANRRQKGAEPKGKGFAGLEASQIPARKKVTPRRRVSEASVVPAGR